MGKIKQTEKKKRLMIVCNRPKDQPYYYDHTHTIIDIPVLYSMIKYIVFNEILK